MGSGLELLSQYKYHQCSSPSPQQARISSLSLSNMGNKLTGLLGQGLPHSPERHLSPTHTYTHFPKFVNDLEFVKGYKLSKKQKK